MNHIYEDLNLIVVILKDDKAVAVNVNVKVWVNIFFGVAKVTKNFKANWEKNFSNLNLKLNNLNFYGVVNSTAGVQDVGSLIKKDFSGILKIFLVFKIEI